MAKIKLTKNELKVQKDALKMYRRYLPTLTLKKQQLQSEIRGIEAKAAAVRAQKTELEQGFADALLSPELTLPQIRDIGGDVRSVVYGRIPLMLLEKCVIREIADCKTCDQGKAELVDRRGVRFPVLRTADHRNVIYNSLPTYTADEQDRLSRYRTGGWHFIFSTERPREVDEVVRAYRDGLPVKGQVRRIGK